MDECLVNEYISAVRGMVCQVLELIADGLKIRQRDVFSRLLRDDESDSLFRWDMVLIPSDPFSILINIGDSLQMKMECEAQSSGRQWEIKESMIYFAAPPLGEKIIPVRSLMEEGEESWYKEFTWGDYKNCAFNSRLGTTGCAPTRRLLSSAGDVVVKIVHSG
ncbi:unnamed protein product [Thlaspi arvense]|uniref:Uncharacterized protein n=1 Tax=Thlaspi arvense TaxID=13288 RepID=A0AAU9SQH6_THLAR|nr:unnamed protein product [Thlaspi arvense]